MLLALIGGEISLNAAAPTVFDRYGLNPLSFCCFVKKKTIWNKILVQRTIETVPDVRIAKTAFATAGYGAGSCSLPLGPMKKGGTGISL